MNWVNTLAGSAAEAANDQVPRDDSTQGNVVPGPWDPHQVWLTRVKQPRDVQRQPANPSPVKVPSQSTQTQFWRRAKR